MEYWLIFCALVLYLIPTLVAWWRSHHQLMAIAALNLLLGWTLVGWVAALVWGLIVARRGAEGQWVRPMTEPPTPHDAERPRVFISYATADRKRVEGLAVLLEALRHHVFIDYRKILPGRRWRDALEQALQVADVLLVFWTRHAAQSKWVRREYESFDTQFPGRPLVSILGDTTSLPERLRDRQYSDLFNLIDLSFLPLLNELFAMVRRLANAGVGKPEIRAAILQRLQEEGIELPHGKRNRLFGLLGISPLIVVLLDFPHRWYDRLVDFLRRQRDRLVDQFAAVPAAYYYSAGAALTAGFIVCNVVPKGWSVDPIPNLFQVDVQLDQSGNDACDSRGMICVSMLRHPLFDVNRKFFGYSTPPCTATVIRESRCLEPFQTDYAVKGVILRRSPEADEGAQDPSPGTDFFCLPAEQGKQGIFQFANCVKP